MTQWQQRVYALAGLCQAAACVQQLAHRGEVTPAVAINPLVNSVLPVDAASIEEIYASETNFATSSASEESNVSPEPQPLRIGLQIFLSQFSGENNKNAEQIELIVNMLRLERALNKNSKALNELASGLKQVARQKKEFNTDNYRILENLAGLYSGIVGPLTRPILVKGKADILKQQAIQNQIRTVLLAGIRSAVLWRQVGGRKRHILFNRSAMVQAAESLFLTSSN